MRLDKYLTECGILSRRDASRAVKLGLVTVDGLKEKDPGRHITPGEHAVAYKNEAVIYQQFTYIMLNKPAGTVSATEDPREQTVLQLLDPRLQRLGLFPCGRLDKDTLGLLILTNDGELAHRLLSPKHHAPKVYRWESAEPLSEEAAERLRAGVELEPGLTTLPCGLSVDSDDRSGTITLTEGKYHQIKRMFEAVGNRITALERISFAGIPLDESLPRGGYRELREAELSLLRSSR